jgi:hypothetical protein
MTEERGRCGLVYHNYERLILQSLVHCYVIIFSYSVQDMLFVTCEKRKCDQGPLYEYVLRLIIPLQYDQYEFWI